MPDVTSVDKNLLRLKTGQRNPPDFEDFGGGERVEVASVPHPTRGKDRVELSHEALKLLEIARARGGSHTTDR